MSAHDSTHRRRRAAVILTPLMLVTSAGLYAAWNWADPVSAASGGSGSAASTPKAATPPAKTLAVTATSVTGLAPGVTRPFTVTVTNNDSGDVRLQSVTARVDTASLTSGCGSANYSLTSYAAQNSTSGPLMRKKGGTASVQLQLTMPETGVNQDACKSRTIRLLLNATAQGK